MSGVLSLFVHRSKVASPGDWARAIRTSGFDAELDPGFDAGSFGGFLPCRYGGEDAGFEYFRETVIASVLDEHVAAQVGARDTMISFVTQSSLRERVTAIVASAVLCAISDGLLWDTEADELVPASRALEWARTAEAQVKAALGKVRPVRK